MNPAIKAALFSALLFPGWGQIYLKKYKRGILIMLPVVAGIVFLTWAIVQVAITVIKAAPFKKGTVDFSAVVNLTVSSIKALNFYYLLLSFLLIIFFWVFSIIDSYLLGKKASIKVTTGADQQSVSPQA
jgi:TM2 domain-containing membrane protein YozV